MESRLERETVKITDEQMIKIVELYEIFKRTHIRLLKEGYTYKSGKIFSPSGEEISENSSVYPYNKKTKTVNSLSN